MEGARGAGGPLRTFSAFRLHRATNSEHFYEHHYQHILPFDHQFPDLFLSNRPVSKRTWESTKLLWVYSYSDCVIMRLACRDYRRAYFHIFPSGKIFIHPLGCLPFAKIQLCSPCVWEHSQWCNTIPGSCGAWVFWFIFWLCRVFVAVWAFL